MFKKLNLNLFLIFLVLDIWYLVLLPYNKTPLSKRNAVPK